MTTECWKCGCQRSTHPIPTCKEFVETPASEVPKREIAREEKSGKPVAERGDHRGERTAEELVRGIVKAALELACLRNNLCFEDSPPMVVEEVSEIVQDTFDAMYGIGTCSEEPCDEVLQFHRAVAESRSTTQQLQRATPDTAPMGAERKCICCPIHSPSCTFHDVRSSSWRYFTSSEFADGDNEASPDPGGKSYRK